MGLLVLRLEFGKKTSQWRRFGETSLYFTAPSETHSIHPFGAGINPVIHFPLGFLGHVGSQMLGVGTCLYRRPQAEAVFLPSQCCFLPLALPGLALSRAQQPARHWQPREVVGDAGSCRLLWAPLAVVSFLQPHWNQPPPELLTGLCWEALGIIPLVSLSSLDPPPGAFCCKNKARRGHAANMCQELQRRKLASFT